MSILSKNSYLQKQVRRQSDGLSQDFAVIERILRNWPQFSEEIREEHGLRQKTRAMLVSSSAFLAVYGAVLGSNHSLWQALSSAVKLPILFLITLFICVPALYIFSVLFGAQQRLSQVVAMVISAVTVTAVLLVSLAPVTFFFLITTSSYQFFKLLNVFFFGIAGLAGVIFLGRGMRAMAAANEASGTRTRGLVLNLWILLYGFVGSQMAWTLRPFVGFPGAEFELVRELGGNVYSNIFYSIGEMLGLLVVL